MRADFRKFFDLDHVAIWPGGIQDTPRKFPFARIQISSANGQSGEPVENVLLKN
jgi:hypothetical protein